MLTATEIAAHYFFKKKKCTQNVELCFIVCVWAIERCSSHPRDPKFAIKVHSGSHTVPLAVHSHAPQNLIFEFFVPN